MQHPEASGQGISRNQLHLSSLEDKITSDNPVRFIDAFIKFIDPDKRTIQKTVKKLTSKKRCVKCLLKSS